MLFSLIETDDLEARWAELMMPVDIVDNDSTCPHRDLKEHPKPANEDTFVVPLGSVMRLSDNQKDIVYSYGAKYPELVREIMVSAAFSNADVQELEKSLQVRPGTLFRWRRNDSANLAELSYEPLTRWNVMAKHVKEPRGAKSVEHLRNLRINDPEYHSLAPSSSLARIREWASKYAPAAGWLDFTELDDNGYVVSDGSDEVQSPGSDSPPPDSELNPEHTSLSRLSRLPRIVSGNLLHEMDMFEEDEPPRNQTSAWRPPAPKINPAFQMGTMGGERRVRCQERVSIDTDDGSEYSNARTERHSLERSSNDTICSFLDDTDPLSSGDWSSRSEELSCFPPHRQTKMKTTHAKGRAPAASAAGKQPPAADDVPEALKPFAAGLALLKETDGDWSEA